MARAARGVIHNWHDEGAPFFMGRAPLVRMTSRVWPCQATVWVRSSTDGRAVSVLSAATATACAHEPKRFSMVAGASRRSGQAA